VVQDAEQHRNIGAGTDPDVLISLGRGTGEARINHDHLATRLLAVQHVQHGHRVRLSGVGADVQRALAVLHVVVRVGHRAIAPGVGHTRNRGRMADARLVVAVVAAPEAHPFAQQVGLLVAVLGRTHHVDAVRTGCLAQIQHLGGNLVQGLVPADALVLAIDELHRIAQTVLAMTVLAQ